MEAFMISPVSRAALTFAAALVAIAPIRAAAPAELTVGTASRVTAGAVPVAVVRRERHPEIRRAIASLQSARTAMQQASHDFGGHRAEALAACDNAIAQLRIALQYDR
jgi:hypothetical protein